MKINEINIKWKITFYLKNYPKIRDNWEYILALIWREEIGEKNHSVSCFAFLAELANGNLTSPETVRRSWQKILEDKPELRGPNYGLRHKLPENPHFIPKKEKFKIPQEKMEF